jgi:amino acid transporter
MRPKEKYIASKMIILITGIVLIVTWLISYFVYHIVGLIQLFFLILFIIVMINFLKAIKREQVHKQDFRNRNKMQ